MKKLIIPLIVMAMACQAIASSKGLFTSSKGSTYVKTCSTPTVAATTLFTIAAENDAESVTYQALAGDIYISTYAATSITGSWKIVSGAAPVTIDSTAFRFGLSTGTTSKDIQILICK